MNVGLPVVGAGSTSGEAVPVTNRYSCSPQVHSPPRRKPGEAVDTLTTAVSDYHRVVVAIVAGAAGARPPTA